MITSDVSPSPYAAIREKFTGRFGGNPELFQSPGRINLIGEHTDYNDGFVMPVAIDKGIQFAIGKSSSGTSTVFAVKYDTSFDIDPSNPAKVESPLWANYLLGVLRRLQDRGFSIGSFHCVIDGNLPTGAGLSSSAALECGFTFALNELFNLQIPKLDMIHIAQWAEHHYAGVKCGIMDQFASMMGREGHAMLLDCRSLEVTYFPLALGNHSLLLCDSGVKHSLASTEYNTRRNECETGVAILKTIDPTIRSLRDVTMATVNKHKNLLPSNVYDRCLYVTAEIQRVIDASQDLQQNRIEAFGKKMYETHEGLSTLFRVSCPELDFLVGEARNHGVVGSRMIGGGFGGCTLSIIRQDAVADFIEHTTQRYRAAFGIELVSYRVGIADGSSLITEKAFPRNVL